MEAAVDGIRGAVSFNAPLKEYTSFRIGGPADVLVEPADVDDVARLVRQTKAQKLPLFVVGGTNLLIRDMGIRGVVVHLGKLRAIREEPGSVLYAEGGVGMPTLIGYAIRHSLAGLEWAAGIPGTVAGCVVMNAGTRLGEMKDSVKAVRLVNRKGEILDLPAQEIPFAYRRATLPAGYSVKLAGAIADSGKAQESIAANVPLVIFIVFTLLMLQLHSFSRALPEPISAIV